MITPIQWEPSFYLILRSPHITHTGWHPADRIYSNFHVNNRFCQFIMRTQEHQLTEIPFKWLELIEKSWKEKEIEKNSEKAHKVIEKKNIESDEARKLVWINQYIILTTLYFECGFYKHIFLLFLIEKSKIFFFLTNHVPRELGNGKKNEFICLCSSDNLQ